MILFTNGCSFTYGSGLKFNNDEIRLKQVWTHHLGNKLNANSIVNLAIGCASNQRIVRTTYNWFFEQYDGKEEVIAVIQLTDCGRYEVYNTDNFYDLTNDELRWSRIKIDLAMRGGGTYSPEEYTKLQHRFYFDTEIENIYNTIRDCAALSNLSNIFPVKVLIWGLSNWDLHYKDKCAKQIKILNKLNYTEIGTLKYDKISEKDPHFSRLGHEQISEWLYLQLLNLQ
jgi:hypothetical protein